MITRLHNAIAAVSNMRRIVNLARRYAMQRTAFGKLLVDHALHLRTLTELEVEVRGSLLMLLESARLLGLQECGLASEHQRHLLRIISPLLKLWTGKQAVAVVSEALESFGGQGYIEDTGIPAILRDTQVSVFDHTFCRILYSTNCASSGRFCQYGKGRPTFCRWMCYGQSRNLKARLSWRC